MEKEKLEEKVENNDVTSEKKRFKFSLVQVVMMIIVGVMLGIVCNIAIIQDKITKADANAQCSEKESNIIEECEIENDVEENIILEYDAGWREKTKQDGILIYDVNLNEIHIAEKPIIYIYPEKEQEVTVKLGNPELLTTTYPQYDEGWKVKAKPDGTLEDIKTGRELYCLYWEGINSLEYNGELKEGFVIKGEETAQFLEEKLEILGLNAKETQEFIIYWLPQLEANNYNYIRFQTQEEIEKNMPLEVTPEPETTIRIMMEWKGLENSIEVEEQILEKVERKGYTVVEWGGTILK